MISHSKTGARCKLDGYIIVNTAKVFRWRQKYVMQDFPQNQCIDSYKIHPSKSSWRTHDRCVRVSVSAESRPSACIFLFLLYCALLRMFLGINNSRKILNIEAHSQFVKYWNFAWGLSSELGTRLNNQLSPESLTERWRICWMLFVNIFHMPLKLL